VKVVEELIGTVEKPVQVLDPFCGTATTGLSAAYHGYEATTIEINPFLVWVARAKTRFYTQKDILDTQHACTAATALVVREGVSHASAPPIHNIERWWSARSLSFLRLLTSAIDAVTKKESAERTLLQVAFCRTLIRLSNAAFNHQSMSFKSPTGQSLFEADLDLGELYVEDVRFVLDGAKDNPIGSCKVIEGDARALPKLIKEQFDLVITSPPYANRMSYIRELRPYMYWLGYLVNGMEAGELDWRSIGGTWGVATSRLNEWERAIDTYWPKELETTLKKIAHKDNANGKLLSNYVSKYFEDIWLHLRGLRQILKKGAQIHYIVGNSMFYGVLLPTEQYYADMLRMLGYSNVSIRAVRKRNSKKELVEFDVSASWPC
jgi:hypothetical protein